MQRGIMGVVVFVETVQFGSAGSDDEQMVLNVRQTIPKMKRSNLSGDPPTSRLTDQRIQTWVSGWVWD